MKIRRRQGSQGAQDEGIKLLATILKYRQRGRLLKVQGYTGKKEHSGRKRCYGGEPVCRSL